MYKLIYKNGCFYSKCDGSVTDKEIKSVCGNDVTIEVRNEN
jgi:hypothetical protein